MKTQIMLLIFQFLVFNAFAQSKEFKQAISNGPNNGIYTAYFQKYYSDEKIKNWCSENNYKILDLKTDYHERFGDYVVKIESVRFMTNDDYLVYLNKKKAKEQQELAEARQRQFEAQQRQAELEQKEKESFWGDVAKAVVVGGALLYGIKEGISALPSSSPSNNGSYNNTQNSNQPTYTLGEWEKISIFGHNGGVGDPEHIKIKIKCNENDYYNTFYIGRDLERNEKKYCVPNVFGNDRFSTLEEAIQFTIKERACKYKQ